MPKPYSFQTDVGKWGGSYAIIIPHKTAKMMIAEQKADIYKKMVRVEVTL